MPSKSGNSNLAGLHSSLGCLFACIPLSLHIKMAQDSTGVPLRYVTKLELMNVHVTDNGEWEFLKYGR